MKRVKVNMQKPTPFIDPCKVISLYKFQVIRVHVKGKQWDSVNSLPSLLSCFSLSSLPEEVASPVSHPFHATLFHVIFSYHTPLSLWFASIPLTSRTTFLPASPPLYIQPVTFRHQSSLHASDYYFNYHFCLILSRSYSSLEVKRRQREKGKEEPTVLVYIDLLSRTMKGMVIWIAFLMFAIVFAPAVMSARRIGKPLPRMISWSYLISGQHDRLHDGIHDPNLLENT